MYLAWVCANNRAGSSGLANEQIIINIKTRAICCLSYPKMSGRVRHNINNIIVDMVIIKNIATIPGTVLVVGDHRANAKIIIVDIVPCYLYVASRTGINRMIQFIATTTTSYFIT